jgi:hypothetical protein
MTMTQDNKQQLFNDHFSQALLKQLGFNHIVNNGFKGKRTEHGHGPYCELDCGSVVYDLDNYQNKSFYGHSHPLFLKAKISAELDFNITSLDEVKKNIQKYVSSKYPVLKDYHLYLCDELPSLDKNSRSVIDLNFLGTTTEAFSILASNETPDIFISNLNLPTFFCWSKTQLNLSETTSRFHIELAGLISRYLFEGNIFGENGHIDRLSKYLKSCLSNCNSNMFNQKCLQVTCERPQFDLEKLLQKGILAGGNDQEIILSFPLSLTREHIDEIIGLIS